MGGGRGNDGMAEAVSTFLRSIGLSSKLVKGAMA